MGRVGGDRGQRRQRDQAAACPIGLDHDIRPADAGQVEAVSVPPPSAWSVVYAVLARRAREAGQGPMSSLPPVPLLRKRTGPPLTWLKAGSSMSPPFKACTWVRELGVVSAVIVVSFGSETRLPGT